MSWNEPGGNPGGKRNPWGGGNKPEQGPPDLDEVLRNLQRRLSGLFGSGKGGNGGAGGPRTPTPMPGGGIGLGVIAAVGLVVWAFTGVYQVDAAERGVIMRFGRHVDTTMPGLRLHLPWPIETKQIVNIQAIESFAEQNRMLTSDENLVDINMEVQYRRANPLDYAFNVNNPEETLKEVSESAIREIIGRSRLDEVLESGRQEIVTLTRELIQRTLDAYKVGLEVTSVNLQDVRVPGEVAPAQADAIKAREDGERVGLAAQAYSNDLIPRARGAGVRQIQEAQGYRAGKIANAEGEAQRFLQLLEEYERAPAVTRERLYIETLEHVYASSKKVMVDSDGSGNMIYLPIDKLLEQGRRTPRVTTSEASVEFPDNQAALDAAARAAAERRPRGAR